MSEKKLLFGDSKLLENMPGAIRQFKLGTEYHFLSNDYQCKIEDYEGNVFTNAEAMFQSYKTRDPKIRKEFATYGAKKAIYIANGLEKRMDWDEDFAWDVMFYVIYQKFVQNPILRAKLIATSGLQLINGNTYGETRWGVCPTKVPIDGKEVEILSGENLLGLILERVRYILLWKECTLTKPREDAHGKWTRYVRLYGPLIGMLNHNSFDEYYYEKERMTTMWNGDADCPDLIANIDEIVHDISAKPDDAIDDDEGDPADVEF